MTVETLIDREAFIEYLSHAYVDYLQYVEFTAVKGFSV